jgi:hypothetical protein
LPETYDATLSSVLFFGHQTAAALRSPRLLDFRQRIRRHFPNLQIFFKNTPNPCFTLLGGQQVFTSVHILLSTLPNMCALFFFPLEIKYVQLAACQFYVFSQLAMPLTTIQIESFRF